MKVKMIHFVTLVIKFQQKKEINGVPMTVQNITVYQTINKNPKKDSYQLALLECQKQYHNMSVIAYTVTEITDDCFTIKEEDNKKIEELENELNKTEEEGGEK